MASKSAALREAISAAGVILGLVFVGYQLQQGNAMARMEANISSGQRWLDWDMSVATDAELSALFARVVNNDLGREDLGEGEAMRIQLLYASALHGWETGYVNFLEGPHAGDFVLPEARLFKGRFSRETWPLVRSEFDSRFAQKVEGRYGLPTEPAG